MLERLVDMRIYCAPENITQDKIVLLDKQQIHHLTKVMRLKKDDAVTIFDGKSKEYDCVIQRITEDKVELAILKIKKVSFGGNLNIALACAIPKNAKMDYIVEKTTELGVDTIIPLLTKRTIVELSYDRAASRIKRWQKIAQEAAKQCGRIRLPKIKPVARFEEAIRCAKGYELAIIPNLAEKTRRISDAISNFKGKSVIAFIGPEGDFTEEEIALAKDSGCVAVSLGELTLRVDTAAISVVSFLRLNSYRMKS